MNGAGRRRGEFCDSPILRECAQSRPELECPHARVPPMAGGEFSPSTVLRVAALQSKSKRFLGAYGHPHVRGYRTEAQFSYVPYDVPGPRTSGLTTVTASAAPELTAGKTLHNAVDSENVRVPWQLPVQSSRFIRSDGTIPVSTPEPLPSQRINAPTPDLTHPLEAPCAMTKMDMVCIAVADLLIPLIAPSSAVSKYEIDTSVDELSRTVNRYEIDG